MIGSREPEETWTGKWFPAQSTEAPAADKNAEVVVMGGMDANSMWKMINSTCDDGKVMLNTVKTMLKKSRKKCCGQLVT